MEESATAIDVKPAQEAAAAEEEISTSAASSSVDALDVDENATLVDEVMEPVDELKSYLHHLRQAVECSEQQKPTFHRSPFAWTDKARQASPDSRCQGDAKVPTAKPQKFNYILGDGESAVFARFDIRDKACLAAGGFRHGQVVEDANGQAYVTVGARTLKGASTLWFQPKHVSRRATCKLDLNKVVFKGVRQMLREASVSDSLKAEDSDGEQVALCRHCHLPLGALGYVDHKQQRCLVHGECMADMMLRDTREAEERKAKQEAAAKRSRREAFDIGWNAARIPSNAKSAEQLKICSNLHNNMYCIVYNEEHSTVTVDATLEPAAAVNLDYLSVALRCRVADGREPWFSLDPTDHEAARSNVQGSHHLKNFEPKWLDNTSVGEVMFQADYHLKELSMGESRQPVIGMHSCVESSGDLLSSDSWTAREWFLVKQAEVCMSEDGALIPRVKLGVEAREQVMGANGMEDAAITRKNHPLVLYADDFSRCFALIAERCSPFFHLRELAKASVLAKFLVDADVNVDEILLEKSQSIQTARGCAEVPQLWNEHLFPVIEVRDGRILENTKQSDHSKVRSVYGGIDFGLDRFVAGAPARASTIAWASIPSSAFAPRPAQPDLQVQPVLLPISLTQPTRALAAISLEAPARPVRARPPTGVSLEVTPGRPEAGQRPARPRPGRRPPRRAPIDPQGVDLGLEEFNLSEATKVDGAARASSLTLVPTSSRRLVDGFWEELDNCKSNLLGDAARQLLSSIYDPALSDRREEGSLFIPVETDAAYLAHLRNLVREEEAVRQVRQTATVSTEATRTQPSEEGRSCNALSTAALDALDSEVVVKASQYVQPAQRKDHHLEYLVLLATDQGSLIRLQRQPNGSNHIDIVDEAQASSARVLHCSECSSAQDTMVTVADMRRFLEMTEAGPASHAARKRFARRAYDQARGLARLQARQGLAPNRWKTSPNNTVRA
eukprot:CAMPEP_0178387574 /NCGR_PEP_ID=MMETSP0689_2-20121128/9144_1 /TAXON_ID=160604 /ORGANISM="Amphidinium massartii, Strain CS-259" /LENGTH=957 /DNA_ID=CAMNT_0020007943 /DNA_START=58 /DNA_END=2931 /DNA_ORIENTATION=+